MPSQDTDRRTPGGAGPTQACDHTTYESGPTTSDALPATGEDADGVEADVWKALSQVDDPEMPISVVDLGLIYGVDLHDGTATVEMTLTYTGCPARELLTGDIEAAVASVDGIEAVDLRLVWSPPWSLQMVTDDGKDRLREFGISV